MRVDPAHLHDLALHRHLFREIEHRRRVMRGALRNSAGYESKNGERTDRLQKMSHDDLLSFFFYFAGTAVVWPHSDFWTGTKTWSPSALTRSARSPVAQTPSTMSNLRARWRKKMRVVFHGLVRMCGAMISRSSCRMSFSAR